MSDPGSGVTLSTGVPMTNERLSTLARAFRVSLRTVEERTESFIRDAILGGDYKPGERLRQGEIAELLGVSRMPVRTSLVKLEAEGLVETIPNVGAVVTVLRAEQIAEIYELRELVETFLLRKAAAHITPAELKQVSDQLAAPEDDLGASWSRRHAGYHELYKYADRPRALEISDRLRLAVGRFFLQRRVAVDADPHLGLVQRLEANDVEGAVELLQAHLRRVSTELQQLVTVNPEHSLVVN
jgi:DNA-binding GntR family transcriptional regulator